MFGKQKRIKMEEFKQVEVPDILKNEDAEVWCNDEFQVNIRFLEKQERKGWVWLSIKKKDKSPIHDWRQLQQIKNVLMGEEREAVELYPAESRLVDSSNQFHLFVMPEGDKFPFGYAERLVVEGHEGGWGKGSSQRPFEKGEQPEDCKTMEQAKKEVEEYHRGKNGN